MNVLITGINGFAGSHLAKYLLGLRDVRVYGTVRKRSDLSGLSAIKNKIRLIYCDLDDRKSVKRALQLSRPDRIYHLAALSYVPDSWKDPAGTLSSNLGGQIAIFESLRELGIKPRVLIAGSSEEYGKVKAFEIPVKETQELRPLSPYGVSKVGQDLLGYQYCQSYKIPVIRTRAFSHTGPGQKEVFAASHFAREIALMEAGKKKPVLLVGNLEARKDYSDVRDISRAYWLALEKGEPGEVYNICSGRGRKMKEILDILLGYSKISIKVQSDPSRMRPSDVPLLVGDASKFRRRTGWTPKIPIEKTLLDLLNDWRGRVRD
jgi:GDP-4-dehydro-6-deoxy-D-mannose reductase